MINPNRILLVDANNLTLRALYGCAPLYDAQGYPTGCLMTSIRMICKIAAEIRPLRTICVWDGGHSKFRKELHPGYKHRGELDKDDPKRQVLDEWKEQVRSLQENLPLLGIGQIQIEGCEADDLIYQLAESFSEEDYHSVVATTDADFFQMVGPNCSIWHLSKEKLFNAVETLKEYDVAPARWVEYRAMTGDKSDNIDGVYGIGPKKAAAILKEFGSLDEFYIKVIKDPEWLQNKGKKHHRDLAAQAELIDRNLMLMGLQYLPETEIPQEELCSQTGIALDLKPNKQAFHKMCMRHQLMTCLEESHYWGAVWKG